MVEVYVTLILNGRRKLEEVPENIRLEVEAKLNEKTEVENTTKNS